MTPTTLSSADHAAKADDARDDADAESDAAATDEDDTDEIEIERGPFSTPRPQSRSSSAPRARRAGTRPRRTRRPRRCAGVLELTRQRYGFLRLSGLDARRRRRLRVGRPGAPLRAAHRRRGRPGRRATRGVASAIAPSSTSTRVNGEEPSRGGARRLRRLLAGAARAPLALDRDAPTSSRARSTCWPRWRSASACWSARRRARVERRCCDARARRSRRRGHRAGDRAA